MSHKLTHCDDEPVVPERDHRGEHEHSLMATATETIDLLRALGARWAYYTVWAHGPDAAIVIRLTEPGSLPAWLDSKRITALAVSDGPSTRMHASLRGGDVLITWPVPRDAAASRVPEHQS